MQHHDKTSKLPGPFQKEKTTNSFTVDIYAAPLQTTFYYSVILKIIDTLTRYYVHSIKSKLRKGREIDGLHSRGNLLEHANLLEQKKALS